MKTRCFDITRTNNNKHYKQQQTLQTTTNITNNKHYKQQQTLTTTTNITNITAMSKVAVKKQQKQCLNISILLWRGVC
jgi:hypothetical protein